MNDKFWQQRGIANWLLLPAAALFAVIVCFRRWCYQRGIFKQQRSSVPVVVVGNLVVGGGGKTPVVIALVRALQERGWNPGVVSRGYGGDNRSPMFVETDSAWQQCGDEPLLIKRQSGVPVCIARRRIAAVRQLAAHGCDIIISDDGLQHYAMARDLEIAVINAAFRYGNGWHLPAGPLRESRSRPCDINITVAADTSDADTAAIVYDGFYALPEPQQRYTAAHYAAQKIIALAAIARPQAFFAALEQQGIIPKKKIALRDHRALSPQSLQALIRDNQADIIIMTEKDAVKYPSHDYRLHALAMRCILPDKLPERVINHIQHAVTP